MVSFDSATKRLFIAVKPELNSTISGKIESLKKILQKSAINWVAWKNLHLTIHFLGETPIDKIENLDNLINASIKDITPFEIIFRSFGIFGKTTPKIIWIGIDDCPQLRLIYNNLKQSLTDSGYKPDEKVYSPHLTIGRVKSLTETIELNNFLLSQKDVLFQNTIIESVLLFESILGPQGAEYRILSEHKLR